MSSFINYNNSGTAKLVAQADSGAINYPGGLIYGPVVDGTAGNVLIITSNGAAKVNIDGIVPVTGTFWQAVQPVSIESIGLPSNAAQESGGNLATIAGAVNSGAFVVKNNGTFAVQIEASSNIIGKVGIDQTSDGTTNAVHIKNFPSTQTVSNVGTFAVQSTQSGTWTVGLSSGTTVALASGTTVAISGTVPVSGSFYPAIQPVSGSIGAVQAGSWNVGQSGTWTVGLSSGTTVALASGTTVAISGTVPVSGTFYLATQPISASSLPLPTGAATSAKQPALGTAGSAATDVISVQGISGGVPQPVSGTVAATQSGTWTVGVSGTVPVSGTFYLATQPISAAALPLPTGASTSAKQPALGTAGSASTDVISVQGVSGGVPQPVSGTVTANAGTNLNTSALALESGGNLATIATAQGASGTGITQPTGGSGILGWLSGIYKTILGLATGQATSAPTITRVNSSATSVSLLAQNNSRKMATFFNEGPDILYLAVASSATKGATLGA